MTKGKKGGKKNITFPIVEGLGLIAEGLSILTKNHGRGSPLSHMATGQWQNVPGTLSDNLMAFDTHVPLIIVGGGVVMRKVAGKVQIMKGVSLF